MKADELTAVPTGENTPAPKKESSVEEFKLLGITVRIRPTLKKGKTRYVLDYRVKGQRKLVWRSTLAKARACAKDAIEKISEGQAEVLKLKAGDAYSYIRARDALIKMGKIEKGIDGVVIEYGEAIALLQGKASVLEACRFWLSRNDVPLPHVTVAEAVEEFKRQCAANGKSKVRLKEIHTVMASFKKAFAVEIQTLEPKMISDYLTALTVAERTRRNYRNVIGYFNRWLALRGYLVKGTDLLDGVQKYSAQMHGEITTYTADEMRRLIAAADKRILPLIVIGGFAGLRHAEIQRLEWEDIDLAEGFIEVKAHKAKTKTRRIVPIKANLKAFLLPLVKKSGNVVTVKNTSKELGKTAAKTADEANAVKALEWKHNALRHTYISARVAESADVSRVADEAGNSPQVIRTNYLKRMRPTAAAEWFGIVPEPKADQ
ncbi:MAG: site-specific integrase [Verrucomicrobiota bacterium]|jgi:integrase